MQALYAALLPCLALIVYSMVVIADQSCAVRYSTMILQISYVTDEL